MTRVAYSLRRHGDTLTFRSGRYVESFDMEFKGWYDLYENIRFAALTSGIRLNQPTLENLLREVKNLVGE